MLKNFLKIFVFCLLLVVLYFIGSRLFSFASKNSGNTVYAPTVVVDELNSDTENVKEKEPVLEEVAEEEVVEDNNEIVEVLPEKINNIVEFISQAPEMDWSEPWQDACEETSLIMIDAYYNNYPLTVDFVKSKIIEMILWEEEKGWSKGLYTEADGLTALQVQELADNFFDYKLKLIKDPSLEDLKYYLSKGNLVLGFFDGKTLENPHFSSGGPEYHAVLLKGYDKNNFITNDPGTRFGADFTYSHENIMYSLHDWIDGDVKSGDKVVLVLE